VLLAQGSAHTIKAQIQRTNTAGVPYVDAANSFLRVETVPL
jgi:hypothetical protein